MAERGRYNPTEDHGEMEGLDDNDHTQYLNAVTDTASVDMTKTGQSIKADVLPGGIHHGDLAGLGDDDHPQYLLETDYNVDDGTTTGKILIWNDVTETWEEGDITDLTAVLPDGTAAGQMLFWTGTEWTYAETNELMWDDTNKRMGIINNAPTSELDVTGTVTMSRLLAGGVNES